MNFDRPNAAPITYESPRDYLSADWPAVKDRITRLALSDRNNNQFVAGQRLYQEDHQPHFDYYRIDQSIAKPLPADVAQDTDDLLPSQVERLKQAENESAEIIAPRLGFVYQAIVEKDFINAVFAIDQQPEILESPPVVETFVAGLVDVVQQSSNLVATLPELHDSLALIEQWNLSDIQTKNLLEPLVHFVYLEKGISLKQDSYNPRQLIYQLSDTLSTPLEEVGHLSNSKLLQYLAKVVNTLEGPELTDLSHDTLLPQKLLESITNNPEIFDQLHPRAQQEIKGTLKGFQLANAQT